jgi:spermidine/putrescine transport system ATP-binding protein
VPDGLTDGNEVQLSVRPEKIWIDDVEDGMAVLDGVVAERVYLGTTTQLIVELAPGARIVALEQNTQRARADDRWELGDAVTVCWRPEHSLVLR